PTASGRWSGGPYARRSRGIAFVRLLSEECVDHGRHGFRYVGAYFSKRFRGFQGMRHQFPGGVAFLEWRSSRQQIIEGTPQAIQVAARFGPLGIPSLLRRDEVNGSHQRTGVSG